MASRGMLKAVSCALLLTVGAQAADVQPRLLFRIAKDGLTLPGLKYPMASKAAGARNCR